MIDQPFTLPCGVTLKNRLAKAATTERLAGKNGKPNLALCNLYRNWSETQAGLLITGNVVVDKKHLESAGNVVADNEALLPEMKEWVAAGQSSGGQIWAQISHSGRQTSRFINWKPLAPSAVQLKKLALFGQPKSMTEKDIQQVIDAFVRTATIKKKQALMVFKFMQHMVIC